MLIFQSANYQGHWAGNSFHHQWKLLPDSYQVSCNEHVLCWFGQLLMISIGGGLQPQILYCNTGTGGGNWLGTRAVEEACELTKAFLTLHSLTSVEKMLHVEKRHNKSY